MYHFDGPVGVTFRWTEPDNRRDFDNVAAGKKILLDALVEGGVIPNDNRRFVRWAVDDPEMLVDKDNPGVLITVESL